VSKTKDLKVLIVGTEISPYSKSGGLGDVIGSLPKELKKQGVDVRVVCPKYKNINPKLIENIEYLNTINIQMGWRNQSANIYCLDNYFKLYLVGNDYYFNRDGLYGYGDDCERFSFFSKSVIELLNTTQFLPDIIHFNDWQTGFGSVYLKDIYHGIVAYSKIKTVFTIHNLQYQGIFDKDVLGTVGLNDGYFIQEKFEFYNSVSMMKAGILYADLVTTVSKTYANEIQTNEYGYGMDKILKANSHKIKGILNGLDYEEYNPELEVAIKRNYDKNTIEFKADNKKHLQEYLNLPVIDVPIFCIVSRLADQKGLDLLAVIMEELLSKEIQFIILGTGEDRYENFFKGIAHKYPTKVSANIYFDENIARKIYSGSDMFLMPSMFEPCGLGQIISMRYGTIPIVRKTGGLSDTVENYDVTTGKGTGFSFETYDANGLMWAINEALKVYYMQNDEWIKVIYNAMNANFSWESSVKEYIDMYLSLKDS
jgi:starch synthase